MQERSLFSAPTGFQGQMPASHFEEYCQQEAVEPSSQKPRPALLACEAMPFVGSPKLLLLWVETCAVDLTRRVSIR